MRAAAMKCSPSLRLTDFESESERFPEWPYQDSHRCRLLAFFDLSRIDEGMVVQAKRDASDHWQSRGFV